MVLENKVAVIHGAGGRIGRAVARTFAQEGARVFQAGRTKATLDEVADGIRSAGGFAETAGVDALDEQAVDTYVDTRRPTADEARRRRPGVGPGECDWSRWLSPGRDVCHRPLSGTRSRLSRDTLVGTWSRLLEPMSMAVR
ncbi:hypothetical protein GCM10010193_40430 [Kitasatospora atroaurantiaca]|uniref:Short subunit dehydrogenase n=1 Tax=Kitasatospora atroaurantiaca TaxID=285545 RepID=A0A561F1I5_9ACTN|nr:SDR family NAD(P)-dependent oxidoreductase [Kitasatospora atroaurantiaca]TWE21723.1 short subunit dehydrogenase [Kitasatospora atroaurantiaca]